MIPTVPIPRNRVATISMYRIVLVSREFGTCAARQSGWMNSGRMFVGLLTNNSHHQGYLEEVVGFTDALACIEASRSG